MKNKVIFGIMGTGLILAAFIVVFPAGTGKDQTESSGEPVDSPMTSEVEDVVKNPGNYKGSINVIGSVIDSDTTNSVFLLGCEDACLVMPVRYAGDLPPVKSRVTVFGEIIRDNGKYLFQAGSLKIQ